MDTVERAFRLAPGCTSIEELRRKLLAEGCTNVDAHLKGALRRELKQLLARRIDPERGSAEVE